MNIRHGDQYIESLTRIPSRSYCPCNWNNHPKLPVRDAMLIFDHLGYLTAYQSSTGVLIEHKDSNRLVHDLEGIFIGYENELGEFVDLTIEQETITVLRSHKISHKSHLLLMIIVIMMLLRQRLYALRNIVS